MEDVLSSFEEEEDIDGDNEKGHAFEEENAEEVDDQEQNDESKFEFSYVVTFCLDLSFR